jgi:hypothetical protein
MGMSSMMIIMMVAGIAALLAGALAILFGIPVKEFSFGNTLILSGAVAACTGMILFALSAVVAELKLIARRLAADSRSAVADPRVRGLLPPVGSGVAPAQQAGAGEGGFLFGRDQAIEHAGGAAPPTAWREETASRTWQETSAEPQDELAPASATKPRRNLMFSSSMRRDRERAQARLGNPATSDSHAQEPADEPGEAPPANFEDAWPKTERARPGEIPPQRRAGRQSSPPPDGGSGAADRAVPAPPERSEELPPVTVLKSGVVDGMAYSLYSDGSIEAQMPEGLMRFASLDELTAHIERRL